MSWVRIHDAALTHPKMTGLVSLSHPFTLWVWGLSYCQTHLTDGLIPRRAVPATCKRAIAGLIERGLWEAHDVGFKVHDYLDWNDSRESVLTKRASLKERVTRSRDRARNAPASSGVVTSGVFSEKGTGEKPTPIADEDSGDLARWLLESYPAWYCDERKGARIPLLMGNLVFLEAIEIVTTWPDRVRLEKLARIVLSTNDPFIAGTDRGWKIFKIKAPWADDKLRQFELENGVAV